MSTFFFFFFQAEDGIRDVAVTGVQTCALPIFLREAKVAGTAWTIPAVSIEDYPRFSWRGMHLDVGRHFMPKRFVKKYIDLLALHKMNRFHWHLTEDQGWRIEIKQYPRLTAVGAWRRGTIVGRPDRGARRMRGVDAERDARA